jgi:hypothetical protein
LPQLQKLAAGGKVHPEVIKALIPGVEADARKLSDEIEHNWLTPEQLAKAPELQRQAAELVAAFRNLSNASVPFSGTSAASATAAKSSELSATPEWCHLAATWKEADEIGSGRRGDYPFDDVGKKRVLADLEKATQDIDALAIAHQLNEGEAGLLKKNLADLTDGVQAMRPTEMQNATCYRPMAMPQPGQKSMQRLTDRLPLLRKLGQSGKIQPEVAAKVLPAIEADVHELSSEKTLGKLSVTDRTKAVDLRRQAEDELDAIRKLSAPAAEKGK